MKNKAVRSWIYLIFMLDFTKILDRRRIENTSRNIFSICSLSDNFCKVENARLRVASYLSILRRNDRSQGKMSRAFFVWSAIWNQ